jgi:hypothetical protein
MSVNLENVKPEMDFKPVDTSTIQEESLVNFAAALGYEPTYKLNNDGDELLCGFFQPKFYRVGKARISVNSAIRMHNEMAEENYAKLKFTPYEEFAKFVADQDNVDEIISIFAGTCKIVETVKANYSRKKGFMVHDHNVKFMSKRDKRQYGF